MYIVHAFIIMFLFNSSVQCFCYSFLFVCCILQHFNAGMVASVFTTVIMTSGERVKCLLQVTNSTYMKNS